MNKALIIGINDYPNAPLQGCRQDAEAICGVLARHADATPDFDCATCEGVPTANEMRELLKVLFFEREGDTALFYFSGHGCACGDKGAGLSFPNGDVLPLAEVLELANKAGQHYKHRVVVLDCCHAGAIGRESMNIAAGVTVMMACEADGCAGDGRHGSVFTSLLVEGLRGAAADIVGDITPSGLYAFVDRSLGLWEDQRPMFATFISDRAVLRKTKPLIPRDVLVDGMRAFGGSDFIALDPSFEFTNDPKDPTYGKTAVEPYANPDNVAVFKKLQALERIGLVVPVGEEHMYFAAMRRQACKLTAAGRNVRDLVAQGLL